MAESKKSRTQDTTSRRPPATTPEARENQLINLAVDLAEQQLIDGTASAQVMTHYLKLGSSREKLEQERIENENRLTQAKIEAMAAAERIEAMYKEALTAMSQYQGREQVEEADVLDD
jgi:hypothetical protein